MISLIVATIHRVPELDRLLVSLEQQSTRDFEVIVVDQNPDDRLTHLLQAHNRLAIRHLRSAPGLSRARNVGLSVSRGELVAFPDDDCWYPPELMASVAAWFDGHPRFALLGTAVRTAQNRRSGPRSPATSCIVTKENVWKCAVSTALFLRRRVSDAVGGFDERIGIGAPSPYQSGEETDYVLRAFDHGFGMWFEASLTVHHPSLDSIARLRKNTYPFALGTGCVLRMHGYSPYQISAHLVRSLGGAVLSLCRCRLDQAVVYALRGAGQLAGYVTSRRNPIQSR